MALDRYDLDRLRRALADRCAGLAEALLGPPHFRGRNEWRWGRRGSLALAVAGPRRGLWHDFEHGEGGDMLALYRRVRGGGFAAALEWARNATGERPHHPPVPWAKPHPESSSGRREACSGASPEPSRTAPLAERVWREAEPARGTLVERYLASRGLRLPEPPDDRDVLRFHSACPRGPERLPAMVALVTCAIRNVPTGVHRTFLRADGTDRIRDERGKAMLGHAGVVRLSLDAEVTQGLGLTEGIETGLAVIQRLGWRPVWVATSAGGIANFPVLPWIEIVTIFADCDSAGRRAAQTCARRWAEAGREARVVTPPQGDWADRPGRGA